MIGHAATTPPLLPVGAPYYYGYRPDPAFTGLSRFPAAAAPAAPPVDASPFIEHWQRFAAPSAGDSAGASFEERWQRFAEPYAKPR